MMIKFLSKIPLYNGISLRDPFNKHLQNMFEMITLIKLRIHMKSKKSK